MIGEAELKTRVLATLVSDDYNDYPTAKQQQKLQQMLNPTAARKVDPHHVHRKAAQAAPKEDKREGGSELVEKSAARAGGRGGASDRPVQRIKSSIQRSRSGGTRTLKPSEAAQRAPSTPQMAPWVT